MTMICDRCGEAFQLSDDVEQLTPFDDELDSVESNAIAKCLVDSEKEIYSLRDETAVLCPSCMAKLNDWLKGEQEQPAWRNPETDPPKVEEEVLIMYQTVSGEYGVTTAHYEDGTLLSQDSIFYWDEIGAWGVLDEEHDDYIIPKGWWEYRHFNADEVYNNRVDYPVVGWMPLPEKRKKEGVK